MRIGQIDFTRLVDIDRDVRFLPDRRNAADMIEVPVSQQDLFNDPPVFTAETHQIMPLCAGINEKAVLCFIVYPEIAIDLEIALDGHAGDHAL